LKAYLARKQKNNSKKAGVLKMKKGQKDADFKFSRKDKLLFLKYAVPCATTLVKRNSISKSLYEKLYSMVKVGKFPQGEPEKIFKVAYAKCAALSIESGKRITKNIIRNYFWFGHDAVIKERYELMRDFDPEYCKTFPGIVIEKSKGGAIVKTAIGLQKVSTDFEPRVKKGDFVAIHRGMIVEKISKSKAMEFAEKTGKIFW
jgi:hydrogenase maturation factor